MTLEKLLLTPKQAAALLGISTAALLAASRRHTNRLPSIRINARVIRYRRATVEKWLERQER